MIGDWNRFCVVFWMLVPGLNIRGSKCSKKGILTSSQQGSISGSGLLEATIRLVARTCPLSPAWPFRGPGILAGGWRES